MSSPVKLTGAILLYFFARTAFSACGPYSGFVSEYSICWKEDIQAFVSESCLHSKCHAIHLPLSKSKSISLKGGKNPASVNCKEYGQQVVILKDKNKNEQAFCLFSDGSLIDVNAIESR